MWELDHKEGWAPKNWCFWTVVLEKTPENPLDYKEIQPVHPKENHWIFIERADAKAETPILWPPDAKIWLIGAFLNYREGGIIYIGVDDDGKAVGVKDIDGDMLKIKDRIRTGISPSPMGLFDVKVEEIGNIPVIKIFIASGSEKPYYKTRYGLSEKGCFMRVGTAAEPMTNEQIEDLFARKVHNSLKNVVSPRQDLTFAQLKIYYTEKGFQLNDNFIRSLDLMTDEGKYNYVAYLLADENGNSMKLAKYAGKDRCNLISNNEYGYCCLITATRKVLDKLDVENKASLE